MVTELQTRLSFRRQANALGVGMTLTEAMPPKVRGRLRRWTNLKRHNTAGRSLGVWLSGTFDYEEPPTLGEMLDAHPLFHTAEEMRVPLLLAQLDGYIVWRDSAEGTVFLPGPKLR